MLAELVDMLFGCQHAHRTFPITPTPGMRSPIAARQTGTYVVCLDCGKELPYDWEGMGIVGRRSNAAPPGGKHAA